MRFNRDRLDVQDKTLGGEKILNIKTILKLSVKSTGVIALRRWGSCENKLERNRPFRRKARSNLKITFDRRSPARSEAETIFRRIRKQLFYFSG